GYFEKKISEKKDARPNSVDRVAHAEILLHLELREAYVDAIEVRQYVADEKDRNDTPGRLPKNSGRFFGNRPRFDLFHPPLCPKWLMLRSRTSVPVGESDSNSAWWSRYRLKQIRSSHSERRTWDGSRC